MKNYQKLIYKWSTPMELSKEQMEKVIYELESNYNSKIFDDENLYEIINLFKKYLNGGKTK